MLGVRNSSPHKAPLQWRIVGCDGVGQREAALNGVAGQHLFTDEVALAIRCAPAGTGDVVGVGGAFDKLSKHGYHTLPKLGGMLVNLMPKL